MATTVTSRRAGLNETRLRRLKWITKAMPPVIRVCLGLSVLLVVTALLAPLLAPYSPREQSLLTRLQPPLPLSGSSLAHPLGTDQLGRDVLSRLLFALRTTLGIASLGMLVGLSVGTCLGLLAGLARGTTEALIMFAVDTQTALPFTLLALTAVAVFGNSPVILVIIIGLAGWDTYARVVRGQVLSVGNQPFVEAARALGSSTQRIAMRHVLPNIASPLLVLATINFSSIVLLESALSFLGLGVQPPNTSLGSMLGAGRDYLASAWWIAAVPGALIVLITMLISLLGDWVRDTMDPNLKGR